MFTSKYALIWAGLTGSIALTSAQSISSGCQAGLAGLVLNPAAQCLNPQGLIPLVTSGNNTSLVQPINSWLEGFCSQALCSNDTLSSVISNVTSSCSAELAGFGLGNITAQLITLVQSGFPLLKQVACLKDNTNNTLCATESINNLQPVTGPFTLSALQQFLGTIVSSSVPNLPASITCTDCAKQTYNLVTQDFPGVTNSDAQQNIQQECGANFTDGQQPSNVVQTASNSTTSGSSGSSNTGNSGAIVLAPGAVGAALSAIMTIASVLTVIA